MQDALLGDRVGQLGAAGAVEGLGFQRQPGQGVRVVERLMQRVGDGEGGGVIVVRHALVVGRLRLGLDIRHAVGGVLGIAGEGLDRAIAAELAVDPVRGLDQEVVIVVPGRVADVVIAGDLRRAARRPVRHRDVVHDVLVEVVEGLVVVRRPHGPGRRGVLLLASFVGIVVDEHGVVGELHLVEEDDTDDRRLGLDVQDPPVRHRGLAVVARHPVIEDLVGQVHWL